MDTRLLKSVEELRAALDSDPRTIAYKEAEKAFQENGEAQALKEELSRFLLLVDKGEKEGNPSQKAIEAKEKLMDLPVSKAYRAALKAYREALSGIDMNLFLANDLPSFFFERREHD